MITHCLAIGIQRTSDLPRFQGSLAGIEGDRREKTAYEGMSDRLLFLQEPAAAVRAGL